MSKYYEGRISAGPIILCLFALATLFIPLAIEPNIIFPFSKIMPISNTSDLCVLQANFSFVVFDALSIADQIPAEVFNYLPYTIYAFYGIVLFDLLFSIILLIIRSEVLRQIIKAISIILGIAMIIVTLASILPIAGFFTYYLSGGFDGALIFDCIKNQGLLYFVGFFIFALIIMIKQFSSFFGKSY